MSKFLKIMIVLLTIAAVAAPAIAEDRLSLSGEMRVRGWYLDGGEDAGDPNSSTYFDQRLRIGGKLAVAEGLSIIFRTDFSEQDWGTDAGYGRQGWQLDRAYIDWKGSYGHLIAGQYNLVVGNTTIDSQDTGFMYTIPGDLPITFFYQLVDDNETAAADGTEADAQLFGAKLALKGDNYASDIFVASQRGGVDAAAAAPYLPQDAEVYLIGATLATTLGPVKLNAEIDYFGGDYDDNTDAEGFQAFVDGSVAATDTTTVGIALFYAMAQDDDGDERQVYELGNDFNDLDPLNNGPLSNDDLLNRVEVYDFTGNGAGVMAIKGYADFKVSDATAVGASLAFATTEDDDVDDDDLFTANLYMTQKFTDNVSMAAQLGYADQDSENDNDLSIGAALYVNF
jgi:hypothetical protein